jgi:nitrite reductase/ring-hydroxylating ferredoxin subunit
MNSIFTKISIILSLTIIFAIIPACDRDDQIPYVYVNYYINLDNPEFNDLKIADNYAYLTGGVKGIIVYCVYPGEYRAYERNCPYQPYSDGALLKVDSTGTQLVCSSCDSKFLLYDGSKIEGSAKRNVLQYETYLEYNTLHIYNQYY